MSADATGWVWKHSPLTKSGLLVHLALADVTNDMHGNELWCAVKTLAEKTRLDRSTVMLALDALVNAGLLDEKPRPGHTTLYRFRFPLLPVVFSDTLSDSPVWVSDTPVRESDTGGPKSRHELNRTQDKQRDGVGKCDRWADVDGAKAPTVAPCVLDADHERPCLPKSALSLVGRERKDTA